MIEIPSDGDLDYSSDIQELSEIGPIRSSIAKHKAVASQIRLKTKPVGYTGLTSKTKAYLENKKNAFIMGADPKKNAPITFRCELWLQTENGRKSGTRIPMESRAFQQCEVQFLLH